MADRTIFILDTAEAIGGEAGATDRGARPFQTRSRREKAAQRTAVAVDTVKKNMSRFLEDIGSILEEGAEIKGPLTVQKVEVQAQVSASGEISLFGSGVGLEGMTGIKLVFERQQSQT